MGAIRHPEDYNKEYEKRRGILYIYVDLVNAKYLILWHRDSRTHLY